VLRFLLVTALATHRCDFPSRGEGRGFVNCEAMNADAIGLGAVHRECTGVNGSSLLRPPPARSPSCKALRASPVIFVLF